MTDWYTFYMAVPFPRSDFRQPCEIAELESAAIDIKQQRNSSSTSTPELATVYRPLGLMQHAFFSRFLLEYRRSLHVA